MCLESRVGGREGVMGDESGDQQGQSGKDFECHTNKLGVDKLQPEDRSGPLLIIVNKVLLEHKHTHSFTHCLHRRHTVSYDSRVEALQRRPSSPKA